MVRRQALLIGSGPANLALLTCLAEMRCRNLDHVSVIEKRDSAVWHPGIEFEESTLQVSLYKDLAFLRNPSSPFTFFSFLREKGLLYHFIHTNNLYPSRKLFSQYIEWISKFFTSQISFGKEAVGVRYLSESSGVHRMIVTVRDVSSGGLTEVTADDIVVGLGQEPYVPDEFAAHADRVVHSNFFLTRLRKYALKPNARVAVVGAGQSAGEITRYLLQQQSVEEVYVIGRRHLFGQTDDNPFVNDLYTYPRSLEFKGLDSVSRYRLLSSIRNTNFSTVTNDVLKDIYDLVFQDKIRGRDRLKLMSYTQVAGTECFSDGLRLNLLRTDGNPEFLTCDIDLLVSATGFLNNRHRALIDPLKPQIEDNEISVNDSFEVKLQSAPESSTFGFGPRIFLMNHSLGVRGPTEHTLAGLAERAAIVAEALQCSQLLQDSQEPLATTFAPENRIVPSLQLESIAR